MKLFCILFILALVPCSLVLGEDQKNEGASEARVYNKGISGQNTKQARKRFAADVLALQPQFVCIYLGINDTLNEPQFVDLPKYIENLEWMIDSAEQNQIRPVLCTMHHCVPEGLLKRHRAESYGTEGPNGKIDRYNAAIRELAAKRKVLLADFAQRTASLDKDVDWVREDGVHLNPSGYKILAETFWAVMEKEGAGGKKIVCLGDSLTYGAKMKGAGTSEGETYPAWLKQLSSQGK